MSTKSWSLMGSNRSSPADRWIPPNLSERFESRWPSRSRRAGDNRLLTGLGFLAVGALVGVGLGLLMAPKSGSELRGDLTRLGRRRMPRLPGPNREPDISMSPEYGTQTSPHTRR